MSSNKIVLYFYVTQSIGIITIKKKNPRRENCGEKKTSHFRKKEPKRNLRETDCHAYIYKFKRETEAEPQGNGLSLTHFYDSGREKRISIRYLSVHDSSYEHLLCTD